MKNTVNILFALLLVISASAQTIVTDESKVSFSLSNMGFNSVEGSIQGLSGSVQFNPANPEAASFRVSLNAATVNTESEKRDEHLRKEDFFSTSLYPKIEFTSSSVKRSGDSFEATGKLKVKDHELEITIPFTYEKLEGNLALLKGKFEVQRLNLGLGEQYGGFMIGKEVEVSIECKIRY